MFLGGYHVTHTKGSVQIFGTPTCAQTAGPTATKYDTVPNVG